MRAGGLQAGAATRAPRGGLRAYLVLLRPPNLVTAAADVLAGFAIAGMGRPEALVWLIPATVFLYGGGVVLNDVFDAKLDGVERPERPIPSRQAPRPVAAAFGAALLALGVLAAFMASSTSGLIALAVAVCAVLYDAAGKHHPLVGPLNMGSCRGLNLLLGISIVPSVVGERWFLALVPLVYIAAVTAVSAGEVHGGRRATNTFALAAVVVVLASLAALPLLPDAGWWGLPLVALLGWRVLPPLRLAAVEPAPRNAGRAVKAGVLSLIVLDAVLAAAFAGPVLGLLVLSLLLVAARVARAFAVT